MENGFAVNQAILYCAQVKIRTDSVSPSHCKSSPQTLCVHLLIQEKMQEKDTRYPFMA